MNVLWFAWLRTRVGTAAETVEPPPEIDTVGKLLDWLAARSPGHAEALAKRAVVRVAVNQEYVKNDHPVKPGDEVAIFPPVTGG
ncbi:MAG: molybdopterin converting factor subunit 1 [Proteobacteria bacterium]|nr:molybdopterin converting factor subunit 1 [Pseudomonadota bacterium]